MGLFNSTVLDWAVGIVFVYLLLAIICTTINEWIAGATAMRSKTLAKAIKQLLDGQPKGDPTNAFLKEFYAHPLIAGMMRPDASGAAAHPAYLQSRQFALTIMDMVTKPGSISFADLEKGITELPDGDVKSALLALIQNASGRLEVAQKNIEQWFDDTMERTTGWYKRRAQLMTIIVAAFLTITTNADTVRVGRILWTNPTARSMMVEKAKARTESQAASSSISYPDKNKPLSPVRAASKDELDKLSTLLGWSGEDPRNLHAWPSRLLGWFLTATAISLGAPFWFDLLNKIMNVRNAGRKPDSGAIPDGARSPSHQPPPQLPSQAAAGGES